MKKFISFQSAIIVLSFLFISLHLCAQPDVKRPKSQTSSVVINTFVNTCFDIYDSEEAIVAKVQSMNGQAGGTDAASMLNKLDECVSGLKNIQNQAAGLIETSTGMFDAAKTLSVFEYLKALKNITNALKVVKYSLNNAKTLYEAISGKAGVKAGGSATARSTKDTATGQKRADKTVPAQQSVVEKSISLTIKKIKYPDVQSIRNFLSNCTGVKSVTVKYDQQAAQIQITNTISTEEIWKQLNAKFPQLLSDESLTALDEEAGKISIALK